MLLSCEKKNEPSTKHPMDVKERAQPYGRGLWLEAPRPTKMVLPVCMETKVLYAFSSQWPLQVGDEWERETENTIVNRAVYQTRCKAAGKEEDVCVLGVDIFPQGGGYFP